MAVSVGVVIDMAVRVGVSILHIHSCSFSTAEIIQWNSHPAQPETQSQRDHQHLDPRIHTILIK